MAFITKQISVDVASENVFQSIIAKQFDNDSRFLRVQLTNEGKPIAVDPSSTVLINARREDNDSKAFSGVVNEDGTVTVPITSWMLDLDGQVECDISVIDSEQRKLSSTGFTITVQAAAYDGNEIAEDENFDILIELIAKCEKAATAGISQAEALETAYSNILKGRNLLQKTNRGTENWAFDSYDNESDYIIEAVTTEDGTNAMKLTLGSTSSEWSVLMYSLKDTLHLLKPNTRYTLSFDMQTDIAHSYELNICTMGVNGQLVTEKFYAVPVGDQSWEHFVWHFTTNSFSELEQYADSIGIYFNFREGIGYRIIKNLKLEKGSVDTEWCQSPEEAIAAFPEFTDTTAAAFDVTEQFVVDNREGRWITIADTTTIEGVREVITDKDINGNPFECKKVIFCVYLPSNVAKDFPMGVSCGNARYIPCAIDAEKGQIMYEFEVVKDVFCSCSYHCSLLGDGLYGRYETSQKKIFADPNFCTDNFKFVDIWTGADGTYFPLGTRIKIWGLKA